MQFMQPPQVMGEVVQNPQSAPMEGQQVIVVGQGQQYVMAQSQRPMHAMTFLDAIKTCLTKKYADFNGRASRSEYWWFVLGLSLIYMAIGFGGFGMVYVLQSSLSSDQKYMFGGIFLMLITIVSLATLIPSLAVVVRRFHDQGHSGWMIVLGIIPYLGGLIIFVFMLLDGEGQTNRFGPCPTNRLD